jgi:ribosomal protein S18 acetylase RimI-like enzyme
MGGMRPATTQDTQTLVNLMGEFYAESGFVLDRPRAAAAFSALLVDSRLGQVWLVERGTATVGYIVVTFVFAMEYGGLTAVIDDFYVRPGFRDAGAGTAALAEARERCSKLGVRAVSVEVGAENAVAQSVYRRTGFAMTDRRLMKLGLAAPTHEEQVT